MESDPETKAEHTAPRRGRRAGRPAPTSGIRVRQPPWPASGPALAVSLSGGGFRASLAGIGALRALADVDLLGNVRYASSVSGGSWANGLLALNWEELAARDFTLDAVDDLIVRPFVEKISTKSLGLRMALNMWKVLGPRTRTDLLADAFNAWFGDGRRLDDLSPGCRFIFNATNLNSGVRFGFERDRVGDYKSKYIRAPEMLIAEAVAASAALPGALAVHHLRTPYNVYPWRDRPKLVDGAVYDNLGVEPFMQLRQKPLLVMLDAGAKLHQGVTERLGLVGVLKRSSAVGQNQVTTVRKRWVIDRFRAWEEWEEREPEQFKTYVGDQQAADTLIADWVRRKRKGELRPGELPPPMPPPRSLRGVTFGLSTSMDPKDGEIESTISRHQRYVPDGEASELPPWHDLDSDIPEWRARCVDVPMSVGKFDLSVCRDLIYRGWWLTRESLRTFHPEALPVPPPRWTDWYELP